MTPADPHRSGPVPATPQATPQAAPHAAPHAISATPPETRSDGQSGDTALARPVIVVILYLLNFATGFSVLVGVILVYVWRKEEQAQEWEQTHYTYLIRTFWIGFLVPVLVVIAWVAAFVATMAVNDTTGGDFSPLPALSILLMIGFSLLLAAWFVTRCILSLIRSGERKPMPRPRTWLF